MVKLWVPTSSMEHLLYVVATLLVHVTKVMCQIHQYWMATICKHEGKKEDILQQESCTRTSSMFLEAMKVAQAASKTTELISIDGGVEYGPELPEAVYLHAITSINSTVVSSDEDWHQSPLPPQCHSCLEPE